MGDELKEKPKLLTPKTKSFWVYCNQHFWWHGLVPLDGKVIQNQYEIVLGVPLIDRQPVQVIFHVSPYEAAVGSDPRWLAQDNHLPPMIKYFYSYDSGVLQDGIAPIHRVRWRVK